MDGPLAAGVTAVILKGYPRLSETFIAQELHALEARGVALALFSLRHPTDREAHPVHAEIRAPVVYLPEYLHDEPARVWRAWRAARRLPGYPGAIKAWWRDFRRDPTRSRIRRLGQAFVLAAELPRDVVRLHAHFLHTPASVTLYAAILRELPWSCSAHAKDIWTTPEWEKREKLAACAWMTTCTEVNARHLRGLAGVDRQVDLIYHGLDTRRFAPSPLAHGTGDGTDPERPVRILAVGRAVDKKGFDDLLAALALIPPGRHWRLVHIGDGPLLRKLKDAARTSGLAERIEWRGPQAQAAVLAAYRAADIFALPCRVAADGDRDGLPNVLLEAQSQKLACVSTRISGIPELIQDGVTGLLVEPNAVAALADALTRLIAEPALRRRLGKAGFERATRVFSLDAGADRLAARFAARPAVMKVAFYAPLKPADHPVASGDRQLARALLQALRAGGHETFVASRFRSYDGTGDAARQARLREVGGRLAQRLIVRCCNPIARPDLWFTYHVYHKAPDWLGPAVSRALDIPYVVAEASSAGKQRDGPWAIGYQGSAAAIEAAAAAISLNPVDLAGIREVRGTVCADAIVPPFDLAAFTGPAQDDVAGVPERGARVRLITVAMMRPGAKLASYRLLAAALADLSPADWELVVLGDGPARTEVEAAFASFPAGQVRFFGFQPASRVAAWLRASDVYVWPAIDEAFGLAFIEAQACGLPVVAGNGGGVGAVVRSGRTGLLVPVGDVGAFATATGRLLTDVRLRQQMAAAARAYVRAEHDLPIAAAAIDSVLRNVTARHRLGADVAPAAVR